MIEWLILGGIGALIAAGNDDGYTPTNFSGDPYYGSKGKKRKYTHYKKIDSDNIEYWDDNNKEWVRETYFTV